MISLDSAIFLSHLPYRKGIYNKGGWPEIDVDENVSEIRRKIHGFFNNEILDSCERKTVFFLNNHGGNKGYEWLYVREKEYPVFLRSIYDPPPVIFIAGDGLPAHPGIAIVGTRNPAPVIRPAVFQLVRNIKEKNPNGVIVSGFARGVDSLAHIASVQNKMRTVCVLGSGIFHPSPKSSAEILTMAKKEASPISLISEFPPDMEPMAFNFPRRNRLIAGLSESLIVMQAPEKSGALISARFALEEGREVYVFDHPLLESPGFNEGGRKLLEDGAGILEMDLEGKIICRSLILNQGEQLEFYARRFYGDVSWLGGDCYFVKEDRNMGESG